MGAIDQLTIHVFQSETGNKEICEFDRFVVFPERSAERKSFYAELIVIGCERRIIDWKMRSDLSVPSVREIREWLEDYTDAIRDRPLPEYVSRGSDPATATHQLRPDDDGHSGSAKAVEDVLFDHRDVEGTPDDKDDNSQRSEHPMVIFEVPPALTDADVSEVLGRQHGELARLQQMHSIDALGWYVTFHQRAYQYGVHLPIKGVAFFAVHTLAELSIPLERKLEVAFHAILRHELFHFAADCMVANWEMAQSRERYWSVREELRNGAGYIELEEALANAYMLRGLRHPTRSLSKSGASGLVTKYTESQPPGYRDGPIHATSRTAYVDGCRRLSAHYWDAPNCDTDWGLDTFLFYPDAVKIDWRRCPVIVHDAEGILETLGIGLDLFKAIRAINDTPTFRKSLRKLNPKYAKLWKKCKSKLSKDVGLSSVGFQRWRKGGPDCYSVRLDGNYRVHLRFDRSADYWFAEAVGDHKSMGHG